MAPGREVEVRLNDEVGWLSKVVARGPIRAGDPITSDQVDLSTLSDLRPTDVDPNAGWTGFVTLGDRRMAAFDFRRNRLTAWGHLDRADAHLAAVTMSRRHRVWSIEALASAVDEAMTATMLSMLDEVDTRRPELRRALRQAAELDNVPFQSSVAADRIGYLARAGRVRRALVRSSTMQQLQEDVVLLVQASKARVGDLPDAPGAA
jgi:hypothetical protein